MKIAVDKVGRGKQRTVNRRFTAMVSHYLFGAEFCNPAAGWEKGQVEKNVRDARHRVWQTLPHPQDKHRTISDVWQAEKTYLMEVPLAFDGFVEFNKRVSSTCLITYDNNRYSVPAALPTVRSACLCMRIGW